MWWRKKAKPKPKLRRTTYNPSQKGKTRVNSSSVRSFNRRYQKSKTKLKKAGFRYSGGKPIQSMNAKEFGKLQSKVDSGRYDVRTIQEPPKWQGEPPREWVLLRKIKR